MQPYATVGAVDHAAAVEFYDAVLAAIGWRSHMSFPGWRAYSHGGSGEGFVLWIVTPFDGAQASAGNGTMVGLPAVSHDEVDAFHAAALRHGGSSEGAPGPRPQYGPHWYAAYVRDPTGNKRLFRKSPAEDRRGISVAPRGAERSRCRRHRRGLATKGTAERPVEPTRRTFETVSEIAVVCNP